MCNVCNGDVPKGATLGGYNLLKYGLLQVI
jgi:hypothetical protein